MPESIEKVLEKMHKIYSDNQLTKFMHFFGDGKQYLNINGLFCCTMQLKRGATFFRHFLSKLDFNSLSETLPHK